MAIQMRRGPLAQYDESKMLAGEWGISIDADSNDQKAFIAFAPGVSKEVMMVEDAQEQIAVATAEAITEATEKAEAYAHGDSFSVNDYASGDGTTTSFTLSETPSSVIAVYVDGAETSAYTRSGAVITFTTAPPVGEDNIRVSYTVNTTSDNAMYYKNQASNYATSAYTYKSAAATSATSAENSATSASGSASSASTSAQTATTQATKAQSYAVGGTSSRTGEDTDNAKYYKEQAEAAAASLDAPKILGDFATYQATNTAVKAYKVGEYLTYNGYLYRVTTEISSGGTITPDTNVVQTDVGTELANRRLWFKNVSVSALTGNIIDLQDSRITSDYVLEGNSITWGDPSKITALTDWSTETAGHFIVTGTCSSATTATFALVKADQQIVST